MIKARYMSSMEQFIRTERSVKNPTAELRLNLINLIKWEKKHAKRGFKPVSMLEYKMTLLEKRETLFERELNGEDPVYHAREYLINMEPAYSK